MKKILFILMVLLTNAVHAYSVCGAPVDGTEYSYTEIMTQGDLEIGNWAVGTGCTGATTNTDVDTMCTNVVAGGQAFCTSVPWRSGDLDETSVNAGHRCWCRRTKMDNNGVLADSVGQWVMLGTLEGKCLKECAKYCAMNVADTAGGMRHAIMLLPQF